MSFDSSYFIQSKHQTALVDQWFRIYFVAIPFVTVTCRSTDSKPTKEKLTLRVLCITQALQI